MSDVEIRRGELFYRGLSGNDNHWPGSPPWSPVSMPTLDLANLRAQLIVALVKVEDALDEQGLLHRVTPQRERLT